MDNIDPCEAITVSRTQKTKYSVIDTTNNMKNMQNVEENPSYVLRSKVYLTIIITFLIK